MGTRIFNVRLTDEEYAALGRVSEERGLSMSALVKDWIVRTPVRATLDDMAGKAHAQCDAEIERLRAELAQKTPVLPPLDMSPDYAALDRELQAEIHAVRVLVPDGQSSYVPALDGLSGTQTTKRHTVPPFLAAPDDDCKACGHDRQSYHLAGTCAFPLDRRHRCGCPQFVDAAEPF